MLKFAVISLILMMSVFSANGQISAQIRERIAAETPPKPVKKTKTEKQAAKQLAKKAKRDKNNLSATVPDSAASAFTKTAKIPDGINLADGLTEDEAVQIALWNNAALNADLSQLGFARADLKEAGLLQNPILSLLFPVGPKQLEAVLNLPIEILYQRPKRVAVATVNLKRVAEGLEQNGLNLVRDVRLGYLELHLAKERVRLADSAMQTRRQIPIIMEARFRVGDVSEAEVVTVQSELKVFEEDRLRFERETFVAEERLRLLMGLSDERTAFEIAPKPFNPVQLASSDELIRSARASRPDLRSAELAIEAAGNLAKWEKSRIFNFIATLDINGKGAKGFEAGPGFVAEIPIFNRNEGGITRAEAEIERAGRQYALIREQIASEVEESRLRLIKTEELITQIRFSVIPALEREQFIQEASFKDGDIPFLFVLQNRQRLDLARLRETEANAEMQRAQVLLDRSVGRISGEK
ncbi:MAG: TolC family protein [Pyrinomonadaceae bacterium]|nr:TolC family protein [Pyrinomonadaceae bacterium]